MALTRLRGAGIAANAVTAAAIAPGAVDITDIADGAIIAAKLANNAVETTKIADANITSAKLADSITLATPTLNSPILTSGSIAGSTVEKLFEKANIQTTAATENLTFNILDQTLLVFTGNSTANVSINFTGNATTTLESLLGSASNTVTAVLAVTNGATPKYVNNVQVDGRIIHNDNIKGNLFWQGNVLTIPGTAVGVDLYSFTIIKKANIDYLVLASQTDFKSFLS